MLLRFSHVMVYAQKQIETVKWYCDKLGFEVDYNAVGEYTSLHHKLLGRLAIHVSDSASSIGKGPLPYFLCKDIHKTLDDLKAKGVKVTEPTREGESPWFAEFFDLEGNRWGVEEINFHLD